MGKLLKLKAAVCTRFCVQNVNNIYNKRVHMDPCFWLVLNHYRTPLIRVYIQIIRLGRVGTAVE